MNSSSFNFFFQAIKLWVFVFFDNSFEDLIENFLISSFKYSQLAWSSLFSLSKFFWMLAICVFVLSRKWEVKANKLLNFYGPFHLTSSWFMLKVKINGEWSEVKAAKMSVFNSLLQCIGDENNVIFFKYIPLYGVAWK